MRAICLRASSIALSFVIATPLTGQQTWSEALSNLLETAEETYAEAGFKLSQDPRNGSLNQLTKEDVWLDLTGGRDYVLVGVCDGDCSDLDLEVFDAGGREVDSDLETDDVPIVEISPESDGRYRVSIGMIACTVEPCFYGVGILERRAREPSEWEQVVIDQLDSFTERMGERGYTRTHGYRTGSLDQGESSTFLVRLQAGTTYGVGAFCDNDCSDLDVHVLAGDETVTEDIAPDDYPAVDFSVTASGVFTIRMAMPGCSSAPCWWGIALHGKPSGGF